MFSRFNKGLMIVMVLIALSAVIYAFAATNTLTNMVPAVGEGSVVVNGYTVTSIVMAQTNQYMNTIAFSVTAPTGATVPTSAKLNTNSVTANYDSWTCATFAGTAPTFTFTCTAQANVVTVASVNTVDISILSSDVTP